MLQDSPVIPYIPASDLARARKFYEEKLGLKPAIEANGGLLYNFGDGSTAFMYVSQGAGTSKASQLFWNVKDVKSALHWASPRFRTRHVGDVTSPTVCFRKKIWLRH